MTDSKMAKYTENKFVAGPVYQTSPELLALPQKHTGRERFMAKGNDEKMEEGKGG